MASDNVVNFPLDKIKNPIADAHQARMDEATDILYGIIIGLVEKGYVPTENEGMIGDLGVVLNILYATICRAEGEEHFLHEMLDEVSHALSEMKKEMKENDHH